MPQLPTGTVTFLFTDIEGSTKLVQELGEAEYSPLLDQHGAIIRLAIAEAGGTELSTEGDAFFAVFQSATQAISAAAVAQRELGSASWPSGVAVKVRMGLHSGEAVLGGDNYLGLEVHRAARIASAGHGGQVLLSSATKALVERGPPTGTTLKSLGDHRLKDLSEPEEIFQLSLNDLPSDFPPIRSLDRRPHNLPLQLTSFIGRDRELAAAEELLRKTRLLTLTGPGGTGKTRLGLQVASRALADFKDGVFFVALASITEPGLIPSAIALALGVPESVNRPVSETVKEWLTDKSMLLVLDNFEQVTAAAPQVSELLASGPGIRILATSREALRIPGEQEFEVPPLSLPDLAHLPAIEALSQFDAVALFLQRAQSINPRFEVTTRNAPAVAEIASRLDGLPLAIELAAARIKLFSPQAMLARMGDRLRLLRSGSRDAPTRQQTLRDAIGWSYDLLGRDEQELFSRLGIFVGGFTLSAAEEVVAGGLPGDFLEGVSSLLDKSLLRQDREQADDEYRFQMLETIREFAVEKLEQSGEGDQIAERHAVFFAGLVQESEKHLTGQDNEAWMNRLQKEHDNVRSVLRWSLETGNAAIGILSIAPAWRFWHFRGHLQEGRAWLERLLELPSANEATPERAKGLSALASLIYWQGDYPAAEDLYQQSYKLFRDLGDLANAAYQALSTGNTYEMRQMPDEAEPYVAESVALYEKAGDEVMAAYAGSDLGWIRIYQGRPGEGRQLLEKSLELAKREGNAYDEANNLMGLAFSHVWEKDYGKAVLVGLDSMNIFRSLGDKSGVAVCLDALAGIYAEMGRHPEALKLSGAAEAIREGIGGGAPPESLGLTDPRAAAAHDLSADEISELVAEGRSWTLDESVSYARGTTG